MSLMNIHFVKKMLASVRLYGGALTFSNENSVSCDDPRQLIVCSWLWEVVSRGLIDVLQGLGVHDEESVLLNYASAY